MEKLQNGKMSGQVHKTDVVETQRDCRSQMSL